MAFGLAAWGTSAPAQVTGVVTDSTAQLQFDPSFSDFGVNGLLTYEGTTEMHTLVLGQALTGLSAFR